MQLTHSDLIPQFLHSLSMVFVVVVVSFWSYGLWLSLLSLQFCGMCSWLCNAMCFYSIRLLFISKVLLWPSGRAQMRPPKPGALFLDCLNTQTFLMATGVGISVCLSLWTLYTPWRPSNYASFWRLGALRAWGPIKLNTDAFFGEKKHPAAHKVRPPQRMVFIFPHTHAHMYRHTFLPKYSLVP